MAKSEKRKHPRVAAKNVGAHVNFADRSTPCVILNISGGGMLVETSEPLPAGIPVAVTLSRPGWTKVLRLPGRVVWALAPKAAAKKGKAPGMRIRFDPLEADPSEMLLELLHELGIGETPPPDRMLADTLPPAEPTAPPPARSSSRAEVPAFSQLRAPPRIEAPAGAPPTRTFRGAPQVDGPNPLARAPQGAASTETLPGHRTQELALKDIVAHISKVDLPAVEAGEPAGATAVNELPPGEGAGGDPGAQVKALKLQLGALARTLEERERELAEVKEALQTKQLLLEKADRERKAAETAIQRLSMQLAARR